MGKRIIIAGGGTGGHIFPAIAIANALKAIDPETELLFVGAKGKMEMQKVPQAGFAIVGLDIAGFNRSSLIKNILLPFKLLKSLFQVSRIFKRFRPDAVIGVGGYSSFPVLKFAQQKGIKSFLHESNSFAGKTNQLLGKKATKIFVASNGMEKFFPADKIMITGNPVRENIANSRMPRNEAIQSFGLDPGKMTLLSIGGSLGAKSINESIASGLEQFEENGIQLIWQTGKPFGDQGRMIASGKKSIWVGEFINNMENAYAASDIIVSRAGAMAIAEICIVQKPAVLVPYPFAAEDHQTVNAENLVNYHAAILIKDSEVHQKLVSTTINLAKDKVLQVKMANNLARLAKRNADEVIAREILNVIQ